MIKTEVTQECIPVELDDSEMKYQITTTVVAPGELPDVYLFVHDVIELTDPKQDVFVRVANPYDLENIVNTRAASILNGTKRYRANAFIVRYTDVELAVQAKQAVLQRIDTAVNTWYTFRSEFEVPAPPPPLPILYRPETDEEYLQTLVNAYKAAVEARISAEADAVLAQAAVTAAEAEAAAAAALVQVYEKEVTFCQTARSTYWLSTLGIKNGVANLSTKSQQFFNDTKAVYNSYGSCGTYPACSAAPGTWQYDLHAKLLVMEAALTGTGGWSTSEPYMALMDSTLAAFCSAASTGSTTAVNNTNTKDLAVANAQTAKEKADASVATAQANEDAALAAIMTVCPTFDISSI